MRPHRQGREARSKYWFYVDEPCMELKAKRKLASIGKDISQIVKESISCSIQNFVHIL